MPPTTDGETEASSHAVTCQGHGESQRDSGPPSHPASSSWDGVLQRPHELPWAGARRPPRPQLLATLKVSPRRLPHPEALTSDLPRGWESPAIGRGTLTLTSVPSAGQLSGPARHPPWMPGRQAPGPTLLLSCGSHPGSVVFGFFESTVVRAVQAGQGRGQKVLDKRPQVPTGGLVHGRGE